MSSQFTTGSSSSQSSFHPGGFRTKDVTLDKNLQQVVLQEIIDKSGYWMSKSKLLKSLSFKTNVIYTDGLLLHALQSLWTGDFKEEVQSALIVCLF